MERITNEAWGNLDPWECCGQDNYCKRGCHDEGGCANGCIVPRLYRRLARYEDLGLMPEEIHELLHSTTGPLHKKLGQWIDAEEQGRLVVLPESTPDIDFMRIFNLIMADAEDRVIVLPVKVDEEVFYLTPYAEEKIQVLPVIQFIIDDKGLSFLAINDACGSNFTIDDIGKRAFLTRKEAEAALKGDGAQCEP